MPIRSAIKTVALIDNQLASKPLSVFDFSKFAFFPRCVTGRSNPKHMKLKNICAILPTPVLNYLYLPPWSLSLYIRFRKREDQRGIPVKLGLRRGCGWCGCIKKSERYSSQVRIATGKPNSSYTKPYQRGIPVKLGLRQRRR